MGVLTDWEVLPPTPSVSTPTMSEEPPPPMVSRVSEAPLPWCPQYMAFSLALLPALRGACPRLRGSLALGLLQ